ncbi:MAG: hypothetical protein ACXW4P_27145 [Thermoanaerobaculia bacterium]
MLPAGGGLRRAPPAQDDRTGDSIHPSSFILHPSGLHPSSFILPTFRPSSFLQSAE